MISLRLRPHPSTRSSYRSRGQAMVEFALVLPLLMLLLLMALDFGRVFFGWVGLHNIARIGADYAAQFPTADWTQLDDATPSDPQIIEFKHRIQVDSASINCDVEDPLPAPTFPDGTDVGDDAVIELECEFSLITPFMEGVMGGPVQLRASAVFPIRRGMAEIPTGGGGGAPSETPCALVPDMVGGTVAEARDAWQDRGFVGPFSPVSGFDDDTVTLQTTIPTSAPESDCIPITASVSVTSVTAEGCQSGEFRIPLLTGQTIGDARADWNASPFTGSFSPNGQNNQWAFAQNPAAGECEPQNASMTITPGPTPTPKQCVAPNFVGHSTNEAPGLWSGAEFTGTITYQQQAPPFTVGRQSLVAGQTYDCTSDVRLRP